MVQNMLSIGKLNIGEYRMGAYIYVPMQEYYWRIAVNIRVFVQKSPITKVYSLTILCLIRYI